MGTALRFSTESTAGENLKKSPLCISENHLNQTSMAFWGFPPRKVESLENSQLQTDTLNHALEGMAKVSAKKGNEYNFP